jgi:small-conductance mechanosensitive channel
MARYLRFWIIIICLLSLATSGFAGAADQEPAEKVKSPAITLPEDLGRAMVKEAARVGAEFQQQARSLFERQPLGWDFQTLNYLYRWALAFPLRIDDLVQHILEQGRILGVAGSLIMLTFITAVIYSLIGRKRVLAKVETGIQPFRQKMPEALYPFLRSALKVLVAALIPLLLLGAFSLVNAAIKYKEPWFQLTGRLLGIWAVGALIIGLLRELLTQNLFPTTAQHGPKLFRVIRLAVLYMLGGVALFQAAELFAVRADVLALLKFAISVSIVVVLFLLLLKKKSLLSLFPELPYRSYQGFLVLLNRYYYPLMSLSFLIALLWCIGFREFGKTILTKTWSAGGVYVLIMILYHVIRGWLQKWSVKIDPADEAAQLLLSSLRSLLLYATVIATAVIVMNLVGLLNPLQRVMSFPVVHLGQTPISLWVIIKAILILLAFFYGSRLLQSYLDYKIYPKIGVDQGLGYALNTFFKYLTLAFGFLVALRVVGLDLRILLVFAGAIGIGIGLGLQNMAANVISGFTIIFGRKIRKGDWIQVESKIGRVTDIFLRATMVRTRDNIEYLIPNSNLISNTIVNYSLSSPMILIDLPVGVSYNSDPEEVQRILLEIAEKEPLVSKHNPPAVRFVEFADSSLNFNLLVWIDVGLTPIATVRSALNFAIFREFKKAGIEIPFPQRDVHIRSQVGP